MLIDAEHAFDPAYSKALGVDVESLIVCQPDSGEMALEGKLLDLCLGLLVGSIHLIELILAGLPFLLLVLDAKRKKNSFFSCFPQSQTACADLLLWI